MSGRRRRQEIIWPGQVGQLLSSPIAQCVGAYLPRQPLSPHVPQFKTFEDDQIRRMVAPRPEYPQMNLCLSLAEVHEDLDLAYLPVSSALASLVERVLVSMS